MRLKINSDVKRIADRAGRPYYHWRVFVDENPSMLSRIHFIEYTLHPTSPRPHQTVDKPVGGFALEGNAWDEFPILIDVFYKDGTRERQQYPLDFSKPWPAEPVSA